MKGGDLVAPRPSRLRLAGRFFGPDFSATPKVGRGFNVINGNDFVAPRPSRLRFAGRFFKFKPEKNPSPSSDAHASSSQRGSSNIGNDSKSMGLWTALGGGGHAGNSYAFVDGLGVRYAAAIFDVDVTGAAVMI